MSGEMKDKTCEKCIYRDDERCLRFPPTILPTFESFNNIYPRVLMNKNLYQIACAEYKESK